MAGGIDWFRWHHGSVTDPKFQLVARKAGVTLASVIAVWAYLLESASSGEFRGCFGDIDMESVDFLFGMEDGSTNAIMGAMAERKLIADEFIVAWDKRQKAKEDPNAAERKRKQRERERQERLAAMNGGNRSQNVTPCHAESRDVTQCHDREEKSRVDNSKHTATGRDCDVSFNEFWNAYPRKVAKANAFKVWQKLKPGDALLSTILEAVKAQSKSDAWSREGGKFVPYAATWLNGRRWEDELEPEKPRSSFYDDPAFAGIIIGDGK